jgi:hypothetical protein
VNASEGDPVQQVKDLTGGGVEYSFEAICLKQTAEQAFYMLAKGGTATVIGMIPVGTKIELHGPDFLQEKKIQGSSMGSNRFRVDMPRYVEMYLNGKLKLDEMITREITLEQINEAFTAVEVVIRLPRKGQGGTVPSLSTGRGRQNAERFYTPLVQPGGNRIPSGTVSRKPWVPPRQTGASLQYAVLRGSAAQ